MRLAKRGLVPTRVNLRAAYQSFAELEQVCAGFCGLVNQRSHRKTGRARWSCFPRSAPACTACRRRRLTVCSGRPAR